jgi:hypothetical protein
MFLVFYLRSLLQEHSAGSFSQGIIRERMLARQSAPTMRSVSDPEAGSPISGLPAAWGQRRARLPM